MSLRAVYLQVMAEGFCDAPVDNPEHGPTKCCLAPEEVREHPIVLTTGQKVHIDCFGFESPF
jgi:hypothetical protein